MSPRRMVPLAITCLLLVDGAIMQWFDVPDWLWNPGWLHHLSRLVGHFITQHQTLGLFLVIFVEELGVPLPTPGDVAIAWAGYLTLSGAIPHPLAYVAVVAGAVSGSLCLFTISRRFGHPFVLRFGRYIGLDEERLARTEKVFRRWGPWAIIVGRHIPGMRIVLSAFAGIFGVPYRIFVPCVAISATIWAAIFIELGRVLGRHARSLFRIIPAHLFPLAFLVIVVLAAFYMVYEHAWRPRLRARRKQRRGGSKPERKASS
jgi:membrane protein DedA with SNARE-associated domain